MQTDILKGYLNLCVACITTECIMVWNKSPLPLTDPRDAVPRAHRAVHRCRPSMW